MRSVWLRISIPELRPFPSLRMARGGFFPACPEVLLLGAVHCCVVVSFCFGFDFEPHPAVLRNPFWRFSGGWGSNLGQPGAGDPLICCAPTPAPCHSPISFPGLQIFASSLLFWGHTRPRSGAAPDRAGETMRCRALEQRSTSQAKEELSPPTRALAPSDCALWLAADLGPASRLSEAQGGETEPELQEPARCRRGLP